jgi:hypothetical protein
VLEAAWGGGVAVHSAHRLTFAAICAAFGNSELYELICGQLDDEVTVENVVDRLRLLSAARCDGSTELAFISSHSRNFSRYPDTLRASSFSATCETASDGSESEDRLDRFMRQGTETMREIFYLVKMMRLEYSWTDVTKGFLAIFSEFTGKPRAKSRRRPK